MLFFGAMFIRLSRIQYFVNYVGVEMKTLTSLYNAIRSKLKVSQTRKAATSQENSSVNSHNDQSNRSYEIQGFSVNTLKTGDNKNGDIK